MKLGKTWYKIFRKHIREEYIKEEIEKFKAEVMKENNSSIDDMKIDEGLDLNIEEIFTNRKKDRIIPSESKIQTENVKIRLLTELLTLSNKKIEDCILFLSQNKVKTKDKLQFLEREKRKVKLLLNKKRLIKTKVAYHKERIIELKKNADKGNSIGLEIQEEVRKIKNVIEKLEFEKALDEIREEFKHDGELSAIRESLIELNKRDRMGIIIYSDYREAQIIEGINLIDKVDEFYEELIRR